MRRVHDRADRNTDDDRPSPRRRLHWQSIRRGITGVAYRRQPKLPGEVRAVGVEVALGIAERHLFPIPGEVFRPERAEVPKVASAASIHAPDALGRVAPQDLELNTDDAVLDDIPAFDFEQVAGDQPPPLEKTREDM
jgi:hypothetical protein